MTEADLSGLILVNGHLSPGARRSARSEPHTSQIAVSRERAQFVPALSLRCQ